MYHDSKKPEAYASEWYSKEKYLASYNHFLQPVRGKKFWLKGLPSILPPKVKVQPGRPKRNKIKSKDEPKKVKSGKMSPTIQQKKALQIKKRAQDAVQSTTANIINVQSSYKRKRPIGIGLYIDLQTGEQILNPGMSSERVGTVPVNVPRKNRAHTS
ncbi:hypothetical protein V6N13_016713 [Hibiscus sabdariffa]|uniref:Uncharacterized protein n=1 Tax=Hibiscus sabdariffa TaxID=183260 RepID=A0ABR2PTP4_9ROSI